MSEHALQILERTQSGLVVAGAGDGACSSCTLAGLCGHRLFRRSEPLLLPFSEGCEPIADLDQVVSVRLRVDDRAVLRAAALAYGAPLMAMLSFSLVGLVVWASAAPAFAVIGLLLGHVWARRRVREGALASALVTGWEPVYAGSAKDAP